MTPVPRHASPLLLSRWATLSGRAFPDACAGVEVDGIDLLTLDADGVGCVGLFIRSGCLLDPPRTRMLRTTLEQVRWVCTRLDGDARIYFEDLRALLEQAVMDLFSAH